jgi:hypothetical protein
VGNRKVDVDGIRQFLATDFAEPKNGTYNRASARQDGETIKKLR